MIALSPSDMSSRCVFTLIRGIQGDCPCPICLVRRDQQSKFTVPWPLRSAKDTLMTVNKSRALQGKQGKKGQAEDILKEKGLRDVDVSIMNIILQ